MKQQMKFQILLKKQIQKTCLEISVNKSDIRKKILSIRKKKISKDFEIDFKSLLKITKKFVNKNKIIGGYYPFNYEVDAIKILKKFKDNNYTISLPKIKKNYQMDFFEWSLKDPLSVNKFGIPEPVSTKILYPDILLVPVVAFDKYFNRVGYGGGFYDRYINKLKKRKKVTTIGLAFSFQEVKKIPFDKFDAKLDFIITENYN